MLAFECEANHLVTTIKRVSQKNFHSKDLLGKEKELIS